MKRLLPPLFAALSTWGSTNTPPSWVSKTAIKTKQIVAWTIHQPNLWLIDPHTEFIFSTYLPLHLDPNIPHYEQNRVALSAFIKSLYKYCFQLSRKERTWNFLQNNIGMPLSLYLENLPSDKFSKVYESIMWANPSDKKTQPEHTKVVVGTIMKALYSKFRGHTTGDVPDTIASNSSISPAETTEG